MMERRLAAILAADMVGYSRLMAADETGTIERQKAHRAAVIDPKIAHYGGRIVKTTGDGLLVEFPSVVDAVQCAVDIQREIPKREAGVTETKRISYRVGINLGDIVIDGDDILGDGVNIAARLEGIAESGGICVSDMVHENILAKLDLSFEDWGERPLKNIDRKIRAWHWTVDGPGPAKDVAPVTKVLTLPDKPSIAVLPFENMSGDPTQDYFSDGMTEEIITELSRFRSLFVIGRNSSFAQGASGRCVGGRAPARCPICHRGQRSSGRRPRAHHGATDRSRHRKPALGRTIRPWPGGCLCGSRRGVAHDRGDPGRAGRTGSPRQHSNQGARQYGRA
jgi:adenylate cyclase